MYIFSLILPMRCHLMQFSKFYILYKSIYFHDNTYKRTSLYKLFSKVNYRISAAGSPKGKIDISIDFAVKWATSE